MVYSLCIRSCVHKYMYLCYNYSYDYGTYVCMNILWNLHFTHVSITFIIDISNSLLVLCYLD